MLPDSSALNALESMGTTCQSRMPRLFVPAAAGVRGCPVVVPPAAPPRMDPAIPPATWPPS